MPIQTEFGQIAFPPPPSHPPTFRAKFRLNACFFSTYSSRCIVLQNEYYHYYLIFVFVDTCTRVWSHARSMLHAVCQCALCCWCPAGISIQTDQDKLSAEEKRQTIRGGKTIVNLPLLVFISSVRHTPADLLIVGRPNHFWPILNGVSLQTI